MLFKFFLDPNAEAGVTTAPATQGELFDDGWKPGDIVDGSVIRQDIYGGPMASAICRAVQAAASDFNGAEQTTKFTVVTYDRKDVNRHGNRVNIQSNKYGQGLVDDDWQKNPVVLFDHGFGDMMPIGTGSPLRKSQTKADSTVKFHGKTETSRDVMGLVDAKVLSMASIGFDPRKGVRFELPRTKEDQNDPVKAELMFRQWGWEIFEAELQEWSVVGIGADRGALRQMFDKGRTNGERFGEMTMRWLQMNMALCQAYGVGWTPPNEAPAAGTQRVEVVIVHQNAPAVFPNQPTPGPKFETQAALGLVDVPPIPATSPPVDVQQTQSSSPVDVGAQIAAAIKQAMTPLIAAQKQNQAEIANVMSTMQQRLGILPTS